MRHYFSKNWEAPQSIQTVHFEFRGQAMTFKTGAGVFSRHRVDPGTEALLNSIGRRLVGRRVLDLGCGYGVVGVALMKAGLASFVAFCDINLAGLQLARENLALNAVNGILVCGDGVSPFRDGLFDRIVANPPLRLGKARVMGLLRQGVLSLSPGGELLFVARTNQGALSLARDLRSSGLSVEELDRESGYRVFVVTRCCSDSA